MEASGRICDPSPAPLWKAVKTPEEVCGMQECHRRDGAALAQCLSELHCGSYGGQATSEEEGVSEYDVDGLVTGLRRAYSHDMFISESFPTIAGVGPNGAVVHYR